MDNDYEALRIHSVGNFDAQMSFLAQGTSTYWGGFGIDYSDAGKFKLQTDNLFVGGSTLMTWARNGSVGIGTTSPSGKLHVATTSADPINIALQNSERYWKMQTDGGLLTFNDVSAGDIARVTLDTQGDVGIGTSDIGNSKMKKVEVTPSVAVTSNASSVNPGSNGGYDVSNDNGLTDYGGMGALTVAGVYNKPVVELVLKGNLAANTWYPITTMSQLTNWNDDTGNGARDGFSMYFRIYTYDTSAGGGEYLGSRMSERIWVNAYTSNSVQRQVMHVGAAMGHAPNNGQTAAGSGPYQLSIKHHASNDSYYPANQTIEFLTTAAKTGLTGTGSRIITIYGYIG
jgi:hypothetical protein